MVSAELNKTLHFVITGINVVLSLIFWKLCFISAKKPNQYMSKRLRIYCQICYRPHVLFIIILSIITGIHYFIYADYQTTIYRILRMLLVSSTSQIRYTYLSILISRIIATGFYKTYAKYFCNNFTLIISIIATYTASIIKTYIEYKRIFNDLNEYFYTIYFVIAEHATTLILCQLLYFVNRTKYEKLAYQITLNERHQIYENVKVLKTLWPMILIFSLIAPLGPLSIVGYRYLLGFAGPTSLFYMSYNISFIFMLVVWIRVDKTQTCINIIGKSNIDLNINSCGKICPKLTPVEQYFKDLEKQWN